MKKSSTLALALFFLAGSLHAQFASQVTFQHYFTRAQIDSIIDTQGIPPGFITTEYDVKTYKVTYNTVDADSMPTTATGLMVVPQDVPCDVAILSYQHNNVFRKANAPSQYRLEWVIGVISGSMGLITILPDGIGLGDGPGAHPFLHLQSEATSVIDMVRAVRETVDTTGTSHNEQLFLAGISEGAYASLAAHRYIQDHVPQIHVTATGAIAGYYDLSGTMVNNMILPNSSYSDPSYLPALFYSYNNIYHYAASNSDIFVSPYDTLIPQLYNGSREGFQINQQLPSVPNHVLQPSILDTLRHDPNNFFTRLLRRNDAYNWRPTSRVYMFFCTADEIVPFQHAAAAQNNFLANGSVTTDTLNVGATYNHNLCGQFSTLAAIQLVRAMIFQPLQSHVSTTANTSTGSPNGTASVSDTLGDAPYSWLWSTGDTTATITGLAVGTYTVTITDQSHCTQVASGIVSLANGISDVSIAGISVYPNPAHSQVTIDYSSASDKVETIELLDISGHLIEVPATTHTNSTQLDLSTQARGVYILHLHTASGQELRKKIVLL